MGFWSSGFKRNIAPMCSECGYDKILMSYPFINKGFKQEEVYGDGEKKILIVTEPRNLAEITGSSKIKLKYQDTTIGNDLRSRAMPVDIARDCWIIPAMKCAPVYRGRDGIMDLTPDKIKRFDVCRPWVEKTIKELHPNVVILMGEVAIKSFYCKSGMDYISEYHLSGSAIPNYEFNVWVLPILGFELPYSKQRDEGMNNVFDSMLKSALSYGTIPLPPKPDYDGQVKILTEYEDVVRNFTHILESKPEWLDFDYESNSLKPQAEGAMLTSVSWAYDDNYAYSTPLEGYGHWSKEQQTVLLDLWRKIMAEPAIKKSAHNLAMENSWTQCYLKQKVANWGWDSMIGAHCLDVRRGTKGLKFLTFRTYGFGPYNKDIKPYLEAVGADGLNKIDNADEMKLLHYGGLDSLFGRKLREYQMKAMQVESGRPNRIRDAFLTIYLPGAITMSEMSINGFGCDVESYAKVSDELRKEQVELTKQIQASDEVRTYVEQYHCDFNIGSNDDLRKLLFDILKLNTDKKTDSGALSVNAEVLEEMDVPICKMIHRWRKIEKVCGTFIAQYTREYTADHRIHPSYNLHIARSGRSSSTNPNFQNIPKRDKWMKNIIRTGLFPPEKGFRLAETDYSSLEIRVFTCHSQDPVLIDYLVNGGDMHRDEAVHVFQLPGPEYVHKEIRQCMKMGWNFALLYGSYYRACAKKMWEEIIMRGLCLADSTSPTGKGMTVRDWMGSKGVKTLEDFIWWCKKREEEFWDKFHVTYEYRQKAVAEYVRRGYVETKFGFRRSGVLTNNEITNTPTQGTGSGMLTWSATQLRLLADKEHWRTMQNGQIHDSLVCSIHPDELQHVLTMQKYIMTKKIREVFDWIIVPLDVEAEVTPEIDQPWTELKAMECDETGLWKYPEKH